MKSLFNKREIILWLIILLPFVFIWFYWDRLPEQMPSHWNYKGDVDGYMTKGIGTFLLPLINLGMYFLLIIVPRIDPKKSNFPQFETAYRTIRITVHALLSVIFIVTIFKALQYPVNVGYIINLCLPLMFIVLGNLMGKIRPNYMVGIRTPWTLANEEVWVKTHRATGRVWVAISFVFFCTTIFYSGTVPPWVQLGYISVLVVFPFIYSYLSFREVTKANN